MGGLHENHKNAITADRASHAGFFRKLRIKILYLLASSLPLTMSLRVWIYKRAGVSIGNGCLLGKVNFDGIYPEDVKIGDGCTITNGVVMLTHFYDTSVLTEHAYTRGCINIGSRCYIGMNTIFSKPVTIGDGAVVGAGSVVTKDIPPYEIWAGVPARFIKKRYSNWTDIPKDGEFKPR